MKTGFRFEAVPIKYKTGSMKMYDNSRFSLSSQSLSNQYSTSYNNKMLSKITKKSIPMSAYKDAQTNIKFKCTNERIDDYNE